MGGLSPARAGRDDRRSTSNAGTLRSVELFAGAGGLALGLKRAGFVPSLLLDFDEASVTTLRANRDRLLGGGGGNIRCDDVRDLGYDAYQGIDLVSAGAPCQPFSQGGRLRGEDDDRNMFPEAIRAIREIRPRAFLLENVRGLLFPRARPYFDYLLAELAAPSRARRSGETWEEHKRALDVIPEESHEYRVHWSLVNAADYGLAQARPRLMIVGVRSDEGEWCWPAATHDRRALLRELHANRYWDAHEVPDRVRRAVRRKLPPNSEEHGYGFGQRWRTLRDLTRRLGRPARAERSAADPLHLYVPGARLYTKHTGSLLDWPAKTVKAGVHGSPGGEHILIHQGGSYRYLTVRECATLQGFPSQYMLPEFRSRAMKQLGNAVPVPLAEAMGHRIATVLNG